MLGGKQASSGSGGAGSGWVYLRGKREGFIRSMSGGGVDVGDEGEIVGRLAEFSQRSMVWDVSGWKVSETVDRICEPLRPVQPIRVTDASESAMDG